jgi:hypothetical protein
MGDNAIFAIESNDVTWFEDARRAATWMEPQDVEDGVYRVFDQDGREFDLSVKEGRVALSDHPVRSASDYLATQLREYIQHIRPSRRKITDEELARATLAQLVDEFRAIERPR